MISVVYFLAGVISGVCLTRFYNNNRLVFFAIRTIVIRFVWKAHRKMLSHDIALLPSGVTLQSGISVFFNMHEVGSSHEYTPEEILKENKKKKHEIFYLSVLDSTGRPWKVWAHTIYPGSGQWPFNKMMHPIVREGIASAIVTIKSKKTDVTRQFSNFDGPNNNFNGIDDRLPIWVVLYRLLSERIITVPGDSCITALKEATLEVSTIDGSATMKGHNTLLQLHDELVLSVTAFSDMETEQCFSCGNAKEIPSLEIELPPLNTS